MAKIDLNNLVRPKQVNSPDTKVYEEVVDKEYIYKDLHLDLSLSKTIGIGNNPRDSKDIITDNDILAITNSIRNIFTTKKGEKILAPEFGSSLDQYLFEPVNEVYGRLIGDEILNDIQRFEPRIEVSKISVIPNPDQNQYQIFIYYKFLDIKKESVLNILALKGGEILI